MTPTKEQVTVCLKELHSEFGLDVCFDTKTIAERLNCDPAVLYTDMDSGPLFDLLSAMEIDSEIQNRCLEKSCFLADLGRFRCIDTS